MALLVGKALRGAQNAVVEFLEMRLAAASRGVVARRVFQHYAEWGGADECSYRSRTLLA